MITELTFKGLLLRFYGLISNDNSGFSLKKAAALSGLIEAMRISHEHATEKNVFDILSLWLLFILLCLGVVAMVDVIKLKNGIPTNTNEKTDNNIATST